MDGGSRPIVEDHRTKARGAVVAGATIDSAQTRRHCGCEEGAIGAVIGLGLVLASALVGVVTPTGLDVAGLGFGGFIGGAIAGKLFGMARAR